MERLWAPWRLEFVKAASGGDPLACVFCEAPAAGDDEASLIVHRGRTCLVLLNLYPYANGHLLITPYRHVAAPGELTAEERAELWELLDDALGALDRSLRPHGCNVGLNLGRAAGAGIEGHLHLHVVPRWSGDVNFMPVLADVRVMPQHLEETRRVLVEAWVPSGA
jgi:ATP adenylyltransferase